MVRTAPHLRLDAAAIAQAFRSDNPADDAISGARPNNPASRQHQRALPYTQVGAAICCERASSAYRGTVLAFEFLVLTVIRSSEVLSRLERDRGAVVVDMRQSSQTSRGASVHSADARR